MHNSQRDGFKFRFKCHLQQSQRSKDVGGGKDGECVSYCSVAVMKYHDQGNS